MGLDTKKLQESGNLKKIAESSSVIESAPYHMMKEEMSPEYGAVEKYINTKVGNHATCSTKSCKGVSPQEASQPYATEGAYLTEQN